MSKSDYFAAQLEKLRQKEQYRRFPQIVHKGKFVEQNGRSMIISGWLMTMHCSKHFSKNSWKNDRTLPRPPPVY